MWTVISIILCVLLMLAGIVGSFIPVLPGVPLAWLGLLIYAWVTGFERVSLLAVIIFLVVTLLTLALDFAAPMLGASKYRASKFGIFGAFVGFFIGIIFVPYVGFIVGPFAGAFLGELIAVRKTRQALGSALGALVGFIAGTLFKVIVILVMAGFFIASFF